MRNEVTTRRLLEEVAYPGFAFELMWEHPRLIEGFRGDFRLRVTCKDSTCNVTGKPLSWNGRWWRLSEHMTDSEIVWTCWAAVQMAILHEAREKFTFKGVPIADSHVDVHKLADFMAQPSVKDGRA